MKTKKIIIVIVVMYILHLVIANWPVIKQAIAGTYQNEFVFYDFRLLIIFALVVFLMMIAQITFREKV